MHISIHALREEGDISYRIHARKSVLFLSTPSARRATRPQRRLSGRRDISIHALREEGDPHINGVSSSPKRISIHALREEGDRSARRQNTGWSNFYPRPPRGGRPAQLRAGYIFHGISIHALREEGDHHGREYVRHLRPNFYPRPPRGGRPSSNARPVEGEKFLSTPSARRATSIDTSGII